MALNKYTLPDGFENVYKNVDDNHERLRIYQNEDGIDNIDEYLEGPDIYQNEDVRDHNEEYLEGPDIHAFDASHDFKKPEDSFRNRVNTDGVYNTSAGQINAILKGNVHR